MIIVDTNPMIGADGAKTASLLRTGTLTPPAPREVHIWRAQIMQWAFLDSLALLAPDEKERAGRFRFEADQHRFAITRALLRTILGRYLQIGPQTLRFSYSEFGKPALAGYQNVANITFSVSHSGDYSLLAFGVTADLGIDIEHLRIERDIVQLAKAIYAPSQYHQLLMHPEGVRKRQFLQEWTRREAIGKALGTGIALSSESYDDAVAQSGAWSIRELEAGDNYVASVAVRTSGVNIRMCDCLK